MFKRDSSARFNETDGFDPKYSGGEWLRNRKWIWYFQSGKFRGQALDQEQYRRILRTAKSEPVLVMKLTGTRKRWWMFREDFYWEDEGLACEDVKVLILDRIEQARRKVSRAMARLSTATNAGVMKRNFIPDDVRVHVWQRDRGRCVRCGSQAKLEFDHIIPVSKGGSDTARNIQLLCENCNREKGGNLV